MATRVAGEMYYKLTGQLHEIMRQLRQKDGYPFDPEELSQTLQACIEGRFNTIDIFDYFTPITDADVPTEHQATLAKYRKLAEEHGVSANVPLCYRVRAGFTLKSHAPQVGPCYEDFWYLQGWNFEDKPTEDCLVFWVPRLVTGSTSKTVDEQRNLLSDLRQHLELPEYHLSGFGEVAFVAGLILSHFKVTDEHVPLETSWARTDTCGNNSYHFGSRFLSEGVACDRIRDDVRSNGCGVFALGVEPL